MNDTINSEGRASFGIFYGGVVVLQARLLCSAGLYFRCGDSAILVDALNQPFRSFKAVPDDTAERLIRGQAPYERIDGLFYTHLHPDHYDQDRNRAFLERCPGVRTFFPVRETPEHGLIRAGKFTVEYQYFEHTPCDYAWAKHYVLLLSAGGSTVYIAADAELNPAAHWEFLSGRSVDYGFFNAIYLSYCETRRLLREAVGRAFIYHMPESKNDGIYRKAVRNFARFPEELKGITLLDRYPMDLDLPPERG